MITIRNTSTDSFTFASFVRYGDEGSFLSGFSRVSFDEMHENLYGDVHAQRTGLPRSLNSRGEIGLILFYLGSSMSLSEMLL